MRYQRGEIDGALLMLFVVFSSWGAWFTFVMACAQAHRWVLMAVGAVLSPIGILGGFGLWLDLGEAG